MIYTAGAIIEKEGKFLLLRRANVRVFNNYWTLPGGKIEGNETAEQAVKREIKEETNLDFEPIFFGKYPENFQEYDWKAEATIFYGNFLGDVKINEESSKFGWFSLGEINDMKLAFNCKRIINEFVKAKKI